MAINKTARLFFSIMILCFITQLGYGQKSEINFNAYSGIFSFRGSGSASNSLITAYVPAYPGTFTKNPYGRRNSFSYDLELQAQRISRLKNIFGVGLSFETLKSKVHIDTINGGDIIYFQTAADGQTTLNNTFITVNPFIGHRYIYRSITFDILAGVDLAFCLQSRETGKALAAGASDFLKVEFNRKKPVADIRPRVQIKAEYKKIGFIAGYSLGLVNFQDQGNLKAYSNFLRLGLSYQIK